MSPNTPRPPGLTRRHFLAGAAVAACSCALPGSAAEASALPIVVFSKVYQTLHLNYEEAAEVTESAGLDGIDCPVRPGGEILPENVATELPAYAAALGRRKLKIGLLTTGITGPASPHTESVLAAARKLDIPCYRLGFIPREEGQAVAGQIESVKQQLRELAPLNRRIGLGALFQNHSSTGKNSYLGGNLEELHNLVKDFDPAQIGVAFDIGHALVVHGDDWKGWFEKLKPHIRIVYIKDVKRGGGWVPFGEGEISQVGYFPLLRKMNYRAPISLHLEYDWGGPQKTRPALVKALRESSRKLRGWLAEA
jgi:sugar phosphate isomerase/epimerase